MDRNIHQYEGEIGDEYLNSKENETVEWSDRFSDKLLLPKKTRSHKSEMRQNKKKLNPIRANEETTDQPRERTN